MEKIAPGVTVNLWSEKGILVSSFKSENVDGKFLEWFIRSKIHSATAFKYYPFVSSEANGGTAGTAKQIAVNPNMYNGRIQMKELATLDTRNVKALIEYGEKESGQDVLQVVAVAGAPPPPSEKFIALNGFTVSVVNKDETYFVDDFISFQTTGEKVVREIQKQAQAKGETYPLFSRLASYYAFRTKGFKTFQQILKAGIAHAELSTFTSTQLMDLLEKIDNYYYKLHVLVVPVKNQSLAIGAATSLALVSSAGLAARGWWKRRGKKKTQQMTLELGEIRGDVESLSKTLGVVMAPPSSPPPFIQMESKKTKLAKKKMDMLDILASLRQDVAFYEVEFATITREIEQEEQKVAKEMEEKEEKKTQKKSSRNK